MKQLVRHTIRQYHMLPDGARVLCGLSGGADSVSLVLCLQELGYQVCACHLNHGMRGTQADADEAFCRDFCEKHNIPFVSERCDVFAEAEKRKLRPRRGKCGMIFLLGAPNGCRCRILQPHTRQMIIWKPCCFI